MKILPNLEISRNVAVISVTLAIFFACANTIAQSTRSATSQIRAVTRPSVEEIRRQSQQEDAELVRLLEDRTRQQWTALPAWSNRVSFDTTGRPWFTPRTGSGPQPDLTATWIEEAWADKAAIARGRAPRLIDRRGRMWIDSSSLLRRWDGTKWTQFSFTVHNAPPTTTPATRPVLQRAATRGAGASTRGARVPPARRPPLNFLLGPALADSAGNCWFVLGGDDPAGWEMIRVGDDDRVQQYPLKGEINAPQLLDSKDIRLTEQSGGAIVLSAPIGKRRADPNRNSHEIYVARWNGTEWTNIRPHFCDHPIAFVMPQRDGSIKYVCDGGRVWTYWPEETLESARIVARSYVASLQDPDPEKREVATRGLITIGPQIDKLLPPAEDENLIPEVRIRLEFIRANYEEMAKVDEKGMHTALAFYDVGVQLGVVGPLARMMDGGFVLHARPVKLQSQEEPFPEALVWVDQGGRCTVRIVPRGQFSPPSPDDSPDSGFADASGRLWRHIYYSIGGLPYEFSESYAKDERVQHALPPGMTFDEVYGQDSYGRVFVGAAANRVLVFDETLPEGQKWEYQTTPGAEVTSLSGAHQGWSLLPSTESAVRLKYLSSAGGGTIALPSSIRGEFQITPMTGNAALLQPPITVATGYTGETSLFYDGRNWAQAANVRELVRQNVQQIIPLTPHEMTGPTWRSRIVAPLADPARQLWYSEPRKSAARSGNGSASPAVLDFFDGTDWHDVYSELKERNTEYAGEIIRSADHGRALLVLNASRGGGVLWLEHDRDGQLDLKPIPNTSGLGLWQNSKGVEAADGGVWFATPSNSSGSVYLHKDKLQMTPFNGFPLLCDSKGRVWFAEPQRKILHVKSDNNWYEGQIMTMDEQPLKLLEDNNGHLWLAQFETLSQVELTNELTPTVREVGRWMWDAPKESFEGAFIDKAGWLWFDGKSRRVTRYQLPKTPSAN